MGAVKNWMMEMEELGEESIDAGGTDEAGVLEHVKSYMTVVDESHVKEYTIKILGMI